MMEDTTSNAVTPMGGTGREMVLVSTQSKEQQCQYIKDVFSVIDWITRGGKEKPPVNYPRHSTAIKLEERFRTSFERIEELERKLEQSENENKRLLDKLEGMYRLKEHLESGMAVLTGELESEKWERFDAENRLKSLTREMVQIQVVINDLVGQLREPKVYNKCKVKRERDASLSTEEESEKQVEDLIAEATKRVQERLDGLDQGQKSTKKEVQSIQILVTGLGELVDKHMTPNPSPRKMSLRSRARANPVLQKEASLSPVQPKEAALPPVQQKEVPLPPVQHKEVSPPPVNPAKSKPVTASQAEPEPDSYALALMPTFSAAKRKRVVGWLQESSEYPENPNPDPENPNPDPENPDAVEVPDTDSDYELEDEPEILDISEDLLPPDEEPINVVNVEDDVEHREIHAETGLKKFFCLCGAQFRNRSQLNDHLNLKPAPTQKKFLCYMCMKSFTKHSFLKLHTKRVHDTEYSGGTFGCKFCGQTFDTFVQLKAHKGYEHSDQLPNRRN